MASIGLCHVEDVVVGDGVGARLDGHVGRQVLVAQHDGLHGLVLAPTPLGASFARSGRLVARVGSDWKAGVGVVGREGGGKSLVGAVDEVFAGKPHERVRVRSGVSLFGVEVIPGELVASLQGRPHVGQRSAGTVTFEVASIFVLRPLLLLLVTLEEVVLLLFLMQRMVLMLVLLLLLLLRLLRLLLLRE